MRTSPGRPRPRPWRRAHAALLAAAWLFCCLGMELGRMGAARAADLPSSDVEKALPTPPPHAPGFTWMPATQTGVLFTNQLGGDAALTNFVAHNGAGVAVGDIDRDGLPDLYFCNLEGPNQLYRNRGSWRFEEADPGPAACADQLSTGAAFADVDGDGDLDLLVNGIAAGTRLFRNDGRGNWTEATDTGLSRTASATTLALADIDGDGDLDLYCAHFIDAMLLADPTSRFAIARRGTQWEVTKFNGESTRNPRWKGRFEALEGGKVRELPEVHGLYRNEGGGRFRAIESEPGTYLDEGGNLIPPHRDWGLAAMFRDFNRDGYPDLYVCNDNTSPDRIWINTGKGTFRAVETMAFRHTSRSSMGVDMGDINRDGIDDVVVVDMLARERSRRLTQLVRDRPALADIENPATRPQFNRNTLFFGRTDGTYAEAALWAGIAATDWTWCPILLDVDLDGFEDLLVSNGFQSDVMDQDSEDQLRNPRQRLTDAQLKRSMQFRPTFHTRNAAFRNRGDGGFVDTSADWHFDRLGVSFGMALGDLDDDGDLDVVINQLNEPAGLYRNDADGGRIAVRLLGPPGNTQGIGARIELSGHGPTQSQEMLCGGRYLSGDQAVRVFAARRDQPEPMRLVIRWTDGRVSERSRVLPDRAYTIAHPGSSAPVVPRAPAKPEPPLFRDVSERLGHRHVDEDFDDASRQPMLPRRLSRLGPGMAAADLDGDGWEDLVVGTGRGGSPGIFRNETGRGFKALPGGAPPTDDQGAVLIWPDGQGHRRILLANATLESPPDTHASITLLEPSGPTPLPPLDLGPMSPGPMVTADFDGDGDLDLFVGGRFQPGRYPEPVASSLWRNDRGTLRRDEEASQAFTHAGLVTGATAADLDGDGDPDLALTTEWGPVRVFRNQKGKFTEATAALGLAELEGLWTGIAAGDFDGDGLLDLACGNAGRNTPYELGAPSMARLFYGDWNTDGILRMVEAWGSGTEAVPMRDRLWLGRGDPGLALRFPTHAAFAKASLAEILTPALAKGPVLQAARLEATLFLNRGTRFEPRTLPVEAQWSPSFAVLVADWNGDGREDLFLSQNFFGGLSDLSREDAGDGLLLLGDGKGRFHPLSPDVSGIRVPGEQRGAVVADFNQDGRPDLAVSQNQGTTRWFENASGQPGLRVTLQGPPGNPDAIGAVLQLIYPGGRTGPARAIQSGSGYWSQDSPRAVLGLDGVPESIRVRWPGGRETQTRIPAAARAVTLPAPSSLP